MLGRAEEGIPILRAGLDKYAASGQRSSLESFSIMLAEALGQSGSVDAALAVLDVAANADIGEEFDRAYGLRVRAELLAADAAAPANVAAVYDAALAAARRIGARSLALRAATSYARWLHAQGRRHQASARLAAIYAEFTQGLETIVLREARGVLEALGNSAGPELSAAELGTTGASRAPAARPS